ncbi:MAG: hypothetical protein WAW37_00275 [Syntrophobacteraceae bacterium]
MLDKRTLHMKVQEQCDCFAETDPLREMAALKGEPDTEEGALKWLALAVLHGINDNAKKITVSRAGDGGITITAKYRESELPSPGGVIGEKIFDVVKGITHIEGEKGKVPVAIGIRDSSIELKVKVAQDGKAEEVVLEFPE